MDELAARLRALRTWSGVPYRELHRRVVQRRQARGVAELPVFNTVYRCLQPGRTRLDVELVVDVATALLGDDGPAAQWRQAHQAVLGLADEAAIVSAADRLPDDLATFTGRHPAMDAVLDSVLAADFGVVVVSGMAGVGKTSLAVRLGHDLLARGRFADVRLAVNLRGHDPTRPPADPAAVLDAFLRRLGVPGDQIHGMDLARRRARYRELLAGRRAVVLLDNAATEDQVRPLLPDGPRCLALVTSRHRLAGLPATGRVELDVFTGEESLTLLRRTVGAERVDEAADVAARIADLVGHLPLALGLVAARIAARPSWTLADHLDRLVRRRADRRLDDGVELAVGLSYDGLDPDRQRMLRLLTLHPGDDLDAYAVAALVGGDLPDARRQLDLLLAANLLLRRTPGRYEFHDSVRVYATNQAHDEDPGRERIAAQTRLFDHLLHTASRAADLVAPHEKRRRPSVADPGWPTPELADVDAALAWLDAHRATLVATARYAADHGWPTHTSRLSSVLFRYLDSGAHHQDAATLHARAVEVSVGRDLASALSNLGNVCWRLGRYPAAIEHFERAGRGYREGGDREGEARALGNLAVVHGWTGRYQEALGCYRQVLDVFRDLGDRDSEARTLGNMANLYAMLGQYVAAAEHQRRGLAITREVGDRDAEARAMANLGVTLDRQGRHDEALDCHLRALGLARELGDRVAEAIALGNLGTTYDGLDQLDEALDHHRRGLALIREVNVPAGELMALNGLGATLRRAGALEEAAGHHGAALAMARDLGDRYEQAVAHDGLGHCAEAAGQTVLACEHWTAALALFTALGTPEQAEVRRRLVRR